MPNPAARASLPLLAVVGLVGGVLSGTFGIGGGIVMVPLLVTVLGFDQKRAAATSLLAILPAAISGSVTYVVNGEVDFLAAAFIALGAVGGSFLGSYLLKRTPVTVLQWLFIAFLLVIAVRMALFEPERAQALELTPVLALVYVALGIFMGIASGMFGIGGGVILVPVLVAVVGISDLVAKGTSLLAMIPTAVAGSIPNARNGFVDVRAALVVGVCAAIASIPGALIALALPPRLSSILLAALLVIVAAQLVVRAIRRRGR